MSRLRIKDILTQDEKDILGFEQRGLGMLGFLSEMFGTSQLAGECESLYFLQHSYNKYISSFAKEIIEIYSEGERWYYLEKYLETKFYNKWYSIYNSLSEEYDPKNSFEYTREVTHGKSVTEGGTDTSSYNSNNQITESDSNTENNSVYAFNSIADVPTSKSTDNSNTTHTNIHGGQDTYTKQYTQTNSGKDTTKNSGHDRAISKILGDEIDFRTKYLFYDIIFKDIDSILTLQIY